MLNFVVKFPVFIQNLLLCYFYNKIYIYILFYYPIFNDYNELQPYDDDDDDDVDDDIIIYVKWVSTL